MKVMYIEGRGSTIKKEALSHPAAVQAAGITSKTQGTQASDINISDIPGESNTKIIKIGDAELRATKEAAEFVKSAISEGIEQKENRNIRCSYWGNCCKQNILCGHASDVNFNWFLC